jgi:GNAT superfamily N-acetyltransferase
MATAGNFEIRAMRRSDFPNYRPLVLLAIGKLERTTGLDASAEATIDQLAHRSVFLLGLLRLFGRPVVDVFVASNGRELFGTGTVLWLPETAYVAGMSTKPEVRGRGIASRILEVEAGRARRRHRDWMALDVESDNETAIRVYRKAGFREFGRFSWFTRTGLPPADTVRDPSVREVRPSDWGTLSSRLDGTRPAEYRAAFPARSKVLHHNEILVRGPRMPVKTWTKDLSGGGVAAMRVYHSPATRMGVYFPMTTLPEPPAEELVGLVDAASAWLEPFGPTRLLAAAPEPRAGVAAALERKGFAAVVSSTVMIRRVPG